MNEDDLRDVAERLEALEALAKLFGNSWLEYAKSQIQDEKIRAYLTVFDDAFPGMDHVVEFVRQNAPALAVGEDVQENFAELAQVLLQRQIESAGEVATESAAEVVEEIATESAAEIVEEIPESGDTSADAEENIESAHNEEQEDAKKSTSDEKESNNEDEIDALFG